MRIIIQHTPEIKWYTRLSDWLPGFPLPLDRYSFALSGIETNVPPFRLGAWKTNTMGIEYFIPGSELLKLAETRDLQFLWGIFSMVPGVLRMEDLSVEDDFFLDGNPLLWEKSESNWFIREAVCEVISIDGSCMLVCTANPDLLSYFTTRFRTWEEI